MPLSSAIIAALERLELALDRYAPATFASSLGAEDMVVLDLIERHKLDIEVFTLDTGRLPEATHDLLACAAGRYATPIRIHAPDAAAVEAYVNTHGTNAFRRDIALRKACCAVRKLGPLARALQGKGIWITGLRRAQSVTRTAVPVLEHDPVHGLMKLNPLADWTDEDVATYVREFRVPVSALHAQGYPSIGCAPCTRAVAPGEDPRSGRWWWEAAETRECGLHVAADGRLVRAASRPARPDPQPARETTP